MAVSNVELRVDARNAVNQLNRANKAANTLNNTVGKLLGAFAGIQATKFVFFKTAELEKQTRSLKVLTGSLDDAQKIIKELQQFGAVTPFTSAELIETAKRLKAFGFETEKIVDVTKRLGDIAGATGADLGGIATAFGQIQAKGRLQGEELLQLQERGVDLQGTLRKEYNLTADEFQRALSQGRIGADAVNFALEKLTEKGGKYAEGAISQSDTLSGKLSTLQDNIDTLARTLGEVLSPVIKGIFDQAIQALEAVNRLLGAGRQGGFNRAIGTIGASITFGGTSQAVDDAEKLLGQISSQKNKVGIEQNIQALTKLSNVLKRIPATDPNAGRLVPLQAQIMRLQNQNLQALQNLPAQALQDVEIPELLTARNAEGDKKVMREKAQAEQQRLSFLKQINAEINRINDAELDGLEAGRKIVEQIDAQGAAEIKRGETNLALLQAKIDGRLEEEQLAQKIKAIEESNLNDVQKEKQIAIVKQTAALEKQFKAAEKLDQVYRSIGSAVSDGIVNALTAAVEGTKSLADVASQTLRQVANILLQLGVNTALGGLSTVGGTGSIFSKLFGGFRASGGTVSGGRSYMVGEKGPELFTPGRTGSIAPSGSFGGANVVVNVDASGTQAQGDQPNAKALGAAIGAAVQAELVKQKRPGGLLS